jgi:hypothetical protein
MISHSISYTESYFSIWLIVDAINTNPEFDMEVMQLKKKLLGASRVSRNVDLTTVLAALTAF